MQKTIKKEDLQAVKAMLKPPVGVQLAMKSVLGKHPSWASCLSYDMDKNQFVGS